MIKLERQIDIAQTGQGEKCGQHNPASEGGRIDRVPIFSTGTIHPIFSATRNFALRARGFVRLSFSSGSTGFVVIKLKSRSGLRFGAGHSGRSSHSRLRSRKKFFTMRSSRE